MPYADYTFYTEGYFGKMPAEAFNRFAEKATFLIDAATQDRAKTASSQMDTNLKLACCALADHLLLEEKAEADSLGGMLSSVSNDGYSQSFAEIQKVAAKRRMQIMATYLTYPQNLLSGWA